ncbi:MAG: hypothetical protein IKW08_09005 [Roseburia sp.]|nr:hypothetical protein [Roseburia sp.]
MDYIIENESIVTGIVEEMHDDYIIMYSDSAEGYPNGSRWSISLDVENKDSYTDLVAGDEIVVYHDGNVMETEPLKVGTVYAITLKTPAERADKEVQGNDTCKSICVSRIFGGGQGRILYDFTKDSGKFGRSRTEFG